jgi:hypothetical protein
VPSAWCDDPGLAELTRGIATASVTERDGAALLHQVCVELTRRRGLAACAGLLLDGSTGVVRALVASHPEAGQLARLLEESGHDAASEFVDLTRSPAPGLADAAHRVGLPLSATLTLPGSTRAVGRLRLFADRRDALGPELLDELAPLVEVLGAAMANAEAYRHSTDLVARLSAALATQGPVEQAKGLLAERHRTDLDGAYRMLREQAARRGQSVGEFAADVVSQSWRIAAPEQPVLSEQSPLPEQRAADPAHAQHPSG